MSPASQKLEPKFQFRVSVRTFWHLSQQQAAAVSAQHGPGLVATDGSSKAFCPSCSVAGDCDVLNGEVREWAVIKGVSWWHWLRAVRRRVSGGPADGRCILVSSLSAVLEDVTYDDVPVWSIPFAMTATSAPSRSDCVTENTGRAGGAGQHFLE